MPSDERVMKALEPLSGQRDLFRSAVAEAAEQLRKLLEGYRSSSETDVERAAGELGRFARGRIDPALFAHVFGAENALSPSALEWIDRAEAVLSEVASTTHLMQHVEVTRGGSLRLTIERALARIGRAYGAARVAEYARNGHGVTNEAKFLDAFPYHFWSRAERRVALPLVVELAGADLCVGGLEEFLDGCQRIVLLVNGKTPPAALVRLITPNVFVLQTSKLEDLEQLKAIDGPAIAAVVPEGCAEFAAYDGVVTSGTSGTSGTKVTQIGRIGAFQQSEELLQLRALARRVGADSTEAGEGVTAPATADVLTAWLLRQADLV